MKSKILLIISLIALFVCLFAITVNASAYTPNFGEPTRVDGMTDKATFGDDGKFNTFTSRVLMSDGVTYPAYYIYNDSATQAISFSELNVATGKSYARNTVICLEIPEGVTTLPNCFGASGEAIFWGDKYTSTLEYLKMPSTLTSMSTDATIYSMKALKCVDFADSKVEVIPQRGLQHCSALEEIIFPKTLKSIEQTAFSGCSSLKYVDFSNTQLENLGLRAFFECYGLETVILGASIKKIETQSFYKAGVNSEKDYVVYYISGSLEEIYSEYGTVWQSAKTSVIYYTGTSTDTGITAIRANVTVKDNALIDASAEGFDKNATYSANTIVYNYNKCDAFFGGIHDTGSTSLSFTDFTNKIYEVSGCSRNCGLESVVVNEYAPIFSGVKYSVKENGTALCASYSVNHESLAIYNKYNATLSYGLIASVAPTDNETLLTLDGDKVVTSKENAVLVDIDSKYSGFDFVLRGFKDDGSQDNIALVISAYVNDGKSIYYIGNTTSEKPVEITMAEVKSNLL